MLPFCGYNMGDYFAHWLAIGEGADPAKLPRIYFVNWFRKDADGRFLWPGYGDNCRVLKWIVERLEGAAEARDTPIGRVPAEGSLDLDGLDISAEGLRALMEVETAAWREEADLIRPHYEKFAEHLPAGLWEEHRSLIERLEKAAS
jgi:phosphoenolpyruvate carboxykinase (GTP)